MKRMLVRLGVFNDVDVEDFADHVLPSLALSHIIELLLEFPFQILEGELVSF